MIYRVKKYQKSLHTRRFFYALIDMFNVSYGVYFVNYR